MEPAFAATGGAGHDAAVLAQFPDLGEIRHVHHRGNSPSLADGAGAVLLVTQARCAELGLAPRATVRVASNASVDPVVMPTAGQLAVERAVAAGTNARGHVSRATGAILTATLFEEMERRDVVTGVIGISGADRSRCGHRSRVLNRCLRHRLREPGARSDTIAST